MPIYEYQCSECGALHEALQKISDAPLTDCPACGASALRKKVSAAAFRLKGSGWYETDFKSGGKKNLAGDSGKDSAASEKSGSDSKKESKDSSPPKASTSTDSAS
jgi:putative FmdB family regulatory protein